MTQTENIITNQVRERFDAFKDKTAMSPQAIVLSLRVYSMLIIELGSIADLKTKHKTLERLFGIPVIIKERAIELI